MSVRKDYYLNRAHDVYKKYLCENVNIFTRRFMCECGCV